jgi:hypothetical protein
LITKNTEIQNSFIVATTGISILQTAYLKEYNPDIKMMLGIFNNYTAGKQFSNPIKYV